MNSVVQRVVFLSAFGLCATLGVYAQPSPKLTSLSRAWIQRGTTNELTLYGEDLAGATRIQISGGSGVNAEVLPAPKSAVPITVESSQGGIKVAEAPDSKAVRVRMVSDATASLNERELRVVTPTGASNPLIVKLSPLPEIIETRKGTEPQQIELPIGISGTIGVPGQLDTYRFMAKQGQDLVVDVLAFRTGSALDSSLVIRGASGKELARSEDAKGFDSFLHFRIPEDGDYLIELRDFRYGGSAGHKYHLTAGMLPCVDSVFPAGGQRGHPVDVTLRGCNLGGLGSIRLHPEADAPLGWQEMRLHTASGLSTAFPFQVSDLREYLESEPNDSTAQANAVQVPGTLNGRVGSAKDIDSYKFKVDRTQTLICEVIAQRFGSPLDALLTLRDAGGQVLQQNDDAEGADARIEFAFQKDIEYTLSIQDLLGRGGEEYVYRIAIRRSEPEFTVKFSPDTPRIYCGGEAILRCEVARLAGFASAIRVEALNLPAGLTAAPLLLTPEDPNVGLLVLHAARDLQGGTFPLTLTASGLSEGKRLTRTAEPLAGDQPAKESLITVLDSPAPFALDLLTLSLVLEQEQSASLELLVQRRPGFEGEVKLFAEGYHSGREALSQNLEAASVVVKASEEHAKISLKARIDAEIGSRPIYVRGETTVDGQTITQVSPAIPLTIRQLPFTLANTMKRLSISVVPPGVKSAAAEAEFVVKASRRGWFSDQLNLSLEGLPEGVMATSTNLPSNVGEVTFKLTATDKAPVGKEFPLTVVGSAVVAGRTYQQRTAPMTLTIAKPQEVADNK